MRLIGMKLKGIGPYKDEFSIDFAALSRSHMYLIEGETGAGKTTILDCITYALYGGPSVEDSAKDRIRSRFLGLLNEPSYVDLIFELNGQYYRVRREPDYWYAKKNGNGNSKHAGKANLYRIDEQIAGLTAGSEANGTAERYFTFAENHGTSLAAKASDVGAEIGQLVGLNRSQFSKTIMLAQGRFSEFLRMKPDDRTELVEELFAAQEYRHIQHILDDMRKERGREVAGLRERLADRIRQSRRNAERFDVMHDEWASSDSDIETNVPTDAEPSRDEPAVAGEDPWFWGLDDTNAIAEPAHTSAAIVEQLGIAVAQVKTQATAMVQAAQQHAEDRETVASEQVERRDRCRQLKTYADGERQQVDKRRELAEQHDDIATNRQRLDRAAQAEPVLTQYRDLERRTQECEDARHTFQHVNDQLAELPSRDELDERHRAALQAAGAEESATQKLKIAGSHQSLLDKVASTGRKLQDAEQEVAERQKTLDQCQQALRELPDEAAVNERITRLTEQLAGRELLESQREQAEDQCGHAQTVAELKDRIDDQQGNVDEAQTLSDAANQAYENANHAFSLLGAAQYADALEDGQPCPVCGSPDHPHPYRMPEDAPTKRSVETLRKAARQRERELNDARQELTKLSTRLESEQEQSAGKTVEQARQAVAEAEKALAELDGLATERDGAQRQLQTIHDARDAYDQAQHQYTQAEGECRHAKESHDAAVSDAEGITQESVDRERAEAAKQLDEAKEQAANAKRIAETIKQWEQLNTQRTECTSRENTLAAQINELKAGIDAMLQERGFADIDQAQACALTDKETKRLQDENSEYEHNVSANTALLKEARRRLAEFVIADGTPGPEEVGTLDSSGAAPVAYNDDGSTTALGQWIAGIDMEALDRACTAAETARDTAQIRLNNVTELDHERERCAADLMEAAETWNTAMHDYEPVRTMALLATGGKESPSERKLTLIAYAVTERFRDVLMRANEILKDIQGGVYELRLGEHEGRDGAKTGLPIDVFDRRNEQLRPPSSLSGGETFFVSLALALALADIIQAENGGLSMETLFIDEGFGTLSDDYLDDVMAILRGIATTRDIGIISHVGQLKDQIAERISVRRSGPDGESQLTVVV